MFYFMEFMERSQALSNVQFLLLADRYAQSDVAWGPWGYGLSGKPTSAGATVVASRDPFCSFRKQASATASPDLATLRSDAANIFRQYLANDAPLHVDVAVRRPASARARRSRALLTRTENVAAGRVSRRSRAAEGRARRGPGIR